MPAKRKSLKNRIFFRNSKTERYYGFELASDIIVTSFDEAVSARIPVLSSDAVLAEDFILTVGKALGLKPSSMKYFGIFQGLPLQPTRKFKSIDKIPTDAKDLSIQKWCFDSAKESTLFSDPLAARLVCVQTKAFIQQGLLKPSEELNAELDEATGPPTRLEQYLSLSQDIPGYNDVNIPGCRLHKTFDLLPGVTTDRPVNLRLLRRGMLLGVTRGDEKEEEYFISWRKIQRWRKSEDDDRLVVYDVYSVPSDTYSCLCIHTEQAKYLLPATLEMIKGLQSELDGPIFQTSDMKRNKHREIIAWNNIVYSEIRFNAEREIAEHYVEVSMLK